jgi:putative ABC transport system substrate-binding protein
VRHKVTISFAIALLLTGLVVSTGLADNIRVVIILSQDATPYQDLGTGFRRYLSAHGMSTSFETYSLQGSAAKAAEFFPAMKGKPPQLLLTIGTLATQTALKELPDIPLVAGLVMDLDGMQKSGNVTGVGVEFPIDVQLQWLQRIVPGAGTIGALYNPKENRAKIEAATKIVRGLGLTLVTREVETPRALPDALESIAKGADVLWGLSDQVVLSPQTAEPILLFSLQHRLPISGLTTSWTKAGALYSLDRDYSDLGAQCGELGLKILQGAKPGALPPVPPRKVVYSLNLKTADHMRLDIPQSIIEGAQSVFR